MKKYYLAYGSNLNLEQMEFRCPTANPVGTINLKGHRLAYKGDEDNYAYLTIEPDKDSFVPLGVFELSQSDIRFLDAYEGFPKLYSKRYMSIELNNKKVKALIYVMNEKFDYHLPSIKYIKTCMKGYKDFGFDIEILEKALQYTFEKLNKHQQNDQEYEL